MKTKPYTFWIGIALILVGLFFVFKMAWVHTSWIGLRIGRFHLNGGAVLLPLLAGVALIVYNPKKKTGYLLALIGAILIALALLLSLRVTFHHTSLFNVLGAFGCIAIGLALLTKSTR